MSANQLHLVTYREFMSCYSYLLSIATAFVFLLASPTCSYGQEEKTTYDGLRITSRALTCVIPFQSESLEKFIMISEKVSRQKSIGEIEKLLKIGLTQPKSNKIERLKKSNAYVFVEQDGTKLTTACRIDWEQVSPEGGGFEAAPLSSRLSDTGQLLEAIASRAQMTTGLARVHAIRVEYVVWGDMSGRFQSLRKALHWEVELGENGKKGSASIATFPALKGESAVKLNGSGLMLLRINGKTNPPNVLDSTIMLISSEYEVKNKEK